MYELCHIGFVDEWCAYVSYALCILDTHLVGIFFCFQAEDGIRDLVRSRGLGDVYKRQTFSCSVITIENNRFAF